MKRILIALLIILSSSAAHTNNVYKVFPFKESLKNLYLGTSITKKTLKEEAIKTIIQCNARPDNHEKTDGIKEYFLPFTQNNKLNKHFFDVAFDIIDSALQQKKRILILCKENQIDHGIGICVSYFLKAKKGYTCLDVFEELQKALPIKQTSNKVNSLEKFFANLIDFFEISDHSDYNSRPQGEVMCAIAIYRNKIKEQSLELNQRRINFLEQFKKLSNLLESYREELYSEKVSVIIPGKLYLGSAASAGTKMLKEKSIEVIINCYRNAPSPLYFNIEKESNKFIENEEYPEFKCYLQSLRNHSVTHYCKTMSAEKETKIDLYFQPAYEIIEKAFSKGKRVLIHCQCGRHRSVAICVSYMMKKYKCSFGQAYKFIEKRRPFIEKRNGLTSRLLELEKKIKENDK